MEGPPLWVWAIVVGTIIAGKFLYRWKLTNELSKDTKYSDRSFNKIKGDLTPMKKGSKKVSVSIRRFACNE